MISYVLVVLFLLPTDGLIVGWMKDYPTLSACQAAKVEVERKAGTGQAVFKASCEIARK